jgi:hypothetical protein
VNQAGPEGPASDDGTLTSAGATKKRVP